jgi:hypothetical protein
MLPHNELLIRYEVTILSKLSWYGVTVRGNVTSVNPPLDTYKYAILGVEGGNHVEMPTCQMFETGNMGWLNNTAISSAYLEKTSQMLKPIDCMWIVNVTKDWKVREGFLS